MDRRRAISHALGLVAALFSAAARAQAGARVHRIAFLGTISADAETMRRIMASFKEGLAGEGFVEGRNYAIDFVAEPDVARAPERIRQLLARAPAVLIVMTTPVAQAAAKAARETPILFTSVSDPVESGLVASLARPGGNITGVSTMLPELSGKLVELVRELLPDAARIAVLWNPDNPAKALELRALRDAASRYGIALHEMPARSKEEIEAVLAGLGRAGVRALVILAETLTFAHRTRIDKLAHASRVPVVSNLTQHTEAGGLASYTADGAFLNRRLGALAAKVLAGAKPATLPVELPTRFVLTVNRKTSRALGFAIPQSVLLRADRVIE
jgi:putative ABC transport system substrate-binding protein